MSFISNLYSKLKSTLATRFPKVFKIINKYKSIVKFIFAGGSATLVNLLLLYLFHGLLAWGLILSTSLAFIFAFLVSFILQKFWTFRNYNKEKMPLQLALYLTNSFIGLSLNGLFMHLLVNKLGIWYLLAQVIVSLTIAVYNFLVYKFIIFKFKPNKNIQDENRSQESTIRGKSG